MMQQEVGNETKEAKEWKDPAVQMEKRERESASYWHLSPIYKRKEDCPL